MDKVEVYFFRYRDWFRNGSKIKVELISVIWERGNFYFCIYDF